MNLPETTPLVAVDMDILETNIREMAQLARQYGVALRPHIKTHKSVEIARMQLAAGAVGLTAATVLEAETVADGGCNDIFIAYTLVGADKYQRLTALARRIRLTLAVDSLFGAAALHEAFQRADLSVDVRIEINTGQNRCGVTPGPGLTELARQIRDSMPALRLQGIFTHEGHVYGQPGYGEVERTAHAAAEMMRSAALELQTMGMDLPAVSMGSTPGARTIAAEPGITEMRPGNYVFYDAMQLSMGVVPLERCALRVRSRVVSRPATDRIILDCGSKTLSSDTGKHGPAACGYGLILTGGELVEDARIERLSEEHAVVALKNNHSRFEIGQIVEVIPNHACPVVNLASSLTKVRQDRYIGSLSVDA